MVRRLASAMSLLVFAVCLIAGIEADNPLATTLSRALVAMAGTMVVALIVGAMGKKMLDEHVAAQRAKAASAAGTAVDGASAGTASGAEKKTSEPQIPQTKSVRRDR